MKEKNKTSIIVACIGLVGCIASGIIGSNYGEAHQNQYVESQISNVNGDNNTVTINNVSDLVKEYNKLVSQNDTLRAQNEKYFNDLTESDNKNQELESQMEDVPDIEYNNLPLLIDGSEISINKNHSMVIMNGVNYYSEEIMKSLIPENKSMTINKDGIYIGRVICDKANLADQWKMDVVDCSSEFSGKDSYGNAHMNSICFTYYDGNIIYNLNRNYAYLKCRIAVHESCSIESDIILTITPDTGSPYSVQLDKKTEQFDVEIPINNCSLLTIECKSDTRYSAIISDAVLYN